MIILEVQILARESEKVNQMTVRNDGPASLVRETIAKSQC